MFLVMTDSRETKGIRLFLVDRAKCKTQWWTEDLMKAKIFDTHSMAQSQKTKYRFNSPAIVTHSQAKDIVAVNKEIRERQDEAEDLDFLGNGWDAHKDAF